MMNQPPAIPPRRNVQKLFRRQNSFSGFPSAALSIFNNNASNNNNNNGKATTKAAPSTSKTPESTATETTETKTTAAPPASTTPTVSGSSTLQVFQSPPAASRPPSGFYSLPRHNRPGYLTRGLGIGFHLLARTPQGGPSGPTAAEQLGINTPSLPKGHRRNLSEGNSAEVSKPLSLVPHTRKGTSSRESSGSESKSKTPSSSSKKSSREGDSKSRRRDSDYQSLPRRSSKDPSTKRTLKEGDSKVHSSSTKREIEPKFRSLPRRHEGDARYQAFVKCDPKYQSLPKRHSSHSVSKRRDGEPLLQQSSSPKRHGGDSVHQALSPKRRDGDGGHQPSSPKKRDITIGYLPQSPKRRDIVLVPGYTPQLAKKLETEINGTPTSPKKYDAGPLPQPKKPDAGPGSPSPSPKKPEAPVPQQQMSPKRRVPEPKYQPVIPKKFEYDPKYQVLPTTGFNGEPAYHIQPPKTTESEHKYQPLPKYYDIDPKYQTLPPRRLDLAPKYPPDPLLLSHRSEIPSNYEVPPHTRPDYPEPMFQQYPQTNAGNRFNLTQCDEATRYQTVPPVRHEAENRHHHFVPYKREDELKYQSLHARRSEFDQRYYQPPPTSTDIDHKYKPPPPVLPNGAKFQPPPLIRPEFESKYQPPPPVRLDYESKYQPPPLVRPDFDLKYRPALPVRTDFEAKYQPPLLVRPEFESKYQPLPPVRPEFESKYQPPPPVRPEFESKYQPPPPVRPEFESKFQIPPSIRPEIKSRYQPPPIRSEFESKYQPPPPIRPEFESKYQHPPPVRPEFESKYQHSSPVRPEFESKYQLPPARVDFDPRYLPSPNIRPGLEVSYQTQYRVRPEVDNRYHPPLPRRYTHTVAPNIESKFQPIQAGRADLNPKAPLTAGRMDIDPLPMPVVRPDLEPKYQTIPFSRHEKDPKFLPVLEARPDFDPRYQPGPASRPDLDPKYQTLPSGRPDLEPKFQPPHAARPDIEPKYQQLPPRPDIEPKYQVIVRERPDIEPKYHAPHPRRPDIEPRYQHIPQGRPDIEPQHPPVMPRRPDIEPQYQPLPPRRPDIEPNFVCPVPVRRPDIEPMYQALPPSRPDIEPKYQPLPPRRPDIEPTFPPHHLRRPDIEPPNFHPLPQRRPDIEPKYQTLPLPRPDLEPKHQSLQHKSHDYEFQPIPCVLPNYDPINQTSAPKRTPDYHFHTIPTVPKRRTEGEHMQPQVTLDDKNVVTYSKANNGNSKFAPTLSRANDKPLFQPLPIKALNGEPSPLVRPLKIQVSEEQLKGDDGAPLYETLPPKPQIPLYEPLPPKLQIPLYETLPPKPQIPLYEPLPPKPQIPLYETLPPKPQIPLKPQIPSKPQLPELATQGIVIKVGESEPMFPPAPMKLDDEPLYQTSPQIPEREPLYQAISPNDSDREPLYQTISPKTSEPHYCTAPVKPEDDDGPPYTVMSPKIIEPIAPYEGSSQAFFPPPSPDPADEAPVYQAVTQEMIQDVKSNYRLLQARKLEKEMLKLQAIPKRIKGDKYHSPTKRSFRESDSKYQSFPKRVHKGEREPKYQSLPKKKDKDESKGSSKKDKDESKSKKKEKDKDSDPKSQKSKDKENESKYHAFSRRDRQPLAPIPWSPGDEDGIYSSLEYPSEGPRSEGAPSDDLYSSIETNDGDPLYQCVGTIGKAAYSRPQPPLPAPLRYPRRVDDGPPPLPPPRLTTGPVGPHNPLISPSSLTTVPDEDAPAPASVYPASYPGTSTATPSPDNTLMSQSAPAWPQGHQGEDDVYSSIPSLGSTPETPPATLPRATPIGRVASSASWTSLGTSCRSSWDSLRSDASTNARQRRRRARSDPRMDAGVLHRLAFTVWHTALHIEKENNHEASGASKPPSISSRNTQSAARLTRVMGGEGVGGPGHKMDVVYVTERIISLAFPPGQDDHTYTLHLREVAHMLSSKHGDNFKVFNLSQQGEISHFLPRVLELGWAEQLAPTLERLCTICKALDSWITQHPHHVAVLHARGGYEKLGVVVAAYMHYSNICASTDQALDRYAMKRFFDDKIGQLYHPSQKRYVQYFAGLLSGVIRINSSPLYLHTLTLYGIPHFEPRGGCHLFIKIYQGMTPIYTSGIYNLTEQMRQVTIAFEAGVQLRGDILLKAYHRRLVPASREVIFRMQFHTCAVSEKNITFSRHDLDDACNDMRFPLDGGVELYFTHSPDERPRQVSNVSCDKSPCAIASWNSYENVALAPEPLEEQGVGGCVSHTFGPLDGSLYATVTKKRSGAGSQAHHSPVSPHAPSGVPTPSPHHANGRYAASIDSGIASSNSGGAGPVSPPTSDTSRGSGESRGTATATVTAGVGLGGSGPPQVDARQLDELLQGMLLDIASIPDLRPCQTPAPDIDSIRCPDFVMAPKTESRVSVTRAPPHTPADTYGSMAAPVSPVNGVSCSTTQDSLLDTSMSTTNDELPYHARQDSKPFSYGAVTSSPLLSRRRSASEGGDSASQPPPSPSIHRRNSREALGATRAGLESPRLVRRMSGSVGGTPDTGNGPSRRSPSPSPSPEPGSRGGTLGRQRSHTLTTRIMSGSDSTPNSTLTRSDHTRSASRLDDTMDFSDLHSRSMSSTGSNNLSWLQMQQLKLAERREAKLRAERAPQEARMMSELRTRMQRTTTTSRDSEDGYVSDTTLLSEPSRESSPVKTLPPLTINTGMAPTTTTTPQKPPIGHSTPARGNSAPSSPVLPQRSASRERSVRYTPPQSSQHSLPRKHSDTSHDRERPFVAVKRAHENAKPVEAGDATAALSQLQTSPHGHIQYASYSSASPVDGLLTTVSSSSTKEGLDSLDALSATLASLGSPTHPPTTTSPPNPIGSTATITAVTTTTPEAQQALAAQTSQSRDDSAWQSDTESSCGGNRPITPGFPPATPTTPYLNQGLPPKSPTMQRRAHLGLSSLSSRPTVKKSASLPSKEMGVRSPSPATSQTLRHELNGHSSPAPSLYHSQSRRSSLTSLNESSEVISSHPKFVKDISKFWYKPTITRDEAINMLKDKAPGTFVVRDSNSFPGAFGLALKVSTPPPNVASKSGDPASELVRHFLIEPTSRGVRLKGCANEPVFGSLSALVYQHSITALALPCRLVLPERDPAGVPDTVDSSANTSSSSTAQLLQQGAACNVMYLHSADTESLTGPQAIKRAVSLMLAAKIVPTVVHFKVSGQGITLTDNERKLFFRRHYPVNTISHCGLDPDDRRWAQKNDEGVPVGSHRVFGFVAKKGASRTENQCHILAELEPEQPATAICNFVTKVMMTSVNRPNLV